MVFSQKLYYFSRDTASVWEMSIIWASETLHIHIGRTTAAQCHANGFRDGILMLKLRDAWPTVFDFFRF